MLRASSQALQSGEIEDRRWSEIFLVDAHEEMDPGGDYGHELWARDDMRAVGAPEEFAVSSLPNAVVRRYQQFMVEDAELHPYGSLGAKGVLEHLAVSVADTFEKGLRQSGIDGIDKGTKFISSHGVLDIEHVRLGDELIRSIEMSEKLKQVLEGAMVTREAYHGFVAGMEDLYEQWASRWRR
jgi:hypothetical protein